jgi:hypothetical protein
MAYKQKRIRAIEYRKQGFSYTRIKAELGVSKSTLSLWLREYPLSKSRLWELTSGSEARIEKYRMTMKKKRDVRRKRVFDIEKERLLPLSRKELYIAGLMLYWGEGGKTVVSQISISNTDPEVITFFIRWLKVCMDIRQDQIRIRLHLYSDMDTRKEREYWMRKLELQKENFRSSYVKNTASNRITYKSRGHGTCNVIVYGRGYYERVMLGIQAISGKFVGLD